MDAITMSGILNYDNVFSSPNDTEMNNVYNSIKSAFDKTSLTKGSDALETKIKENNTEEGIISGFDKEGNDRIATYVKAQEKKIVNIDSFYDYVDEFYGNVDGIDFDNNEFTALLKPAKADNDNIDIKVIFNIDDIQESDKKLLFIGAQLIWLVGKERKINNVKGVYKLGGVTNFSKIQMRRTKVLNKKKKSEIEKCANEWSRFFSEI